MYDIGISGAIILSGHNGYQPFRASVGIIGERFEYVGGKEITRADCKVWINAESKILMPGLVNAHCHGDMTLAKGLGDDMTLWEQNQAFADHNWFRKFIGDEDRYYSRQLTYCEALLAGTTFIMENMYWGLGADAARAMDEVGIRGALAEDIRADFARPDIFIADEDLQQFRDTCIAKRRIPVIGGISEEDYDTERLKRIEQKRKSFESLLTCHLAENDWRRDMILEQYQDTPISYLHQNRLLGEHIIGSHVVYASKKEIRYLAETGTKVVNTPLCEMKIADGIAPIPAMVRAGVTVCLGTDGAMWNNSNDIFREMKGMALVHTINSGIRSLSKAEILDMATVNGAKAFHLEKEYGTIEECKKADFILIRTDVPHMIPLHLGRYENITSHVIFNATGNDVTDVFIDGRQIVKNRRIQTVDMVNIMRKVQASSEKIVKALIEK